MHQTTPQHLLPETQPMTAAQHVKRGRSYQHLTALTHPSSWASLVHPHHPRLILELPCRCLCLLGDQPLQHCCAVSRVGWPFIDSQKSIYMFAQQESSRGQVICKIQVPTKSHSFIQPNPTLRMFIWFNTSFC